MSRAHGAEKEALLQRARTLATDVKQAEADQGDAEALAQDLQLQLSNLIEDGVPGRR